MTLPDHTTSIFSGNEASFSTGGSISSLNIPIEQAEILAIQQTPSPEISIFDGGNSPIAISSADQLSPVSTATSPSVVVLPMEGSRDSNAAGGAITTPVLLANLQHVLDTQNFTAGYNSRINDMEVSTNHNTNNSIFAIQDINTLRNVVNPLPNRITDNATAITALTNNVGSNTQNITLLFSNNLARVNDIAALNTITISTRNQVNGLQAQITDNANEIADVDDALMALGNSSGGYDDRIDAVELSNLSQGSELDSHAQSIDDLYTALGFSSSVLDKSQSGYATGTETVLIDFNWNDKLPKLTLSPSHGVITVTPTSTTVSPNEVHQEFVYGHGLVQPHDTGNVDDRRYKFTSIAAILEKAAPTVVALAWVPAHVTAPYPVGTAIYTTESPLTTTTNDCICLRIKGVIGLANLDVDGVSGIINAQICIDTPSGDADVWENIAELSYLFNDSNGTWVEKTFDIMLAYPKGEHSYKFRGLLTIDYAPDDTRVITGAIGISEVIESGSGDILSEDVTLKWDIKE